MIGLGNSVFLRRKFEVGATPPAPFVNTYSMEFDGVDESFTIADNDNLSFGNGVTDSPFSISAWVKMTDATRFRIVNKYDSNLEYLFSTGGTDRIVFNCYDNSASARIGRQYSTALTSFEGQWIHLVATYNGSSSSSGLKIYLNGSRVDDTDSNSGTYTAMENTTAPLEIGKNLTTYASGLIDETAIFNTELSASDVTTIYNSGAPADLSSLSPLSWWRMGDGDTFSNPGGLGNWTLTDNGSGGNDATSVNMEEADRLPISPHSYSQNSFVFDGIDEYITLGNSSNLNVTGDQSVSCWIKFNSNTGTSYVINVKDIFGVYNNQWHHVVFLKDANDLTLYIDGAFESELLTAGGTSLGTTNDARLGARYTNASYYTGSSDEIAIFDYKLTPTQITQIFNNGVPTDISSLNPLGHWRMGESATWNGSQWTLTDQGSGGNNGTSVNMEEADKTGDQPYVI
jgi:hypothetical protein